MKVLIFGSRRWLSPGPIETVIKRLPPGTVVVHGAAPGVDNIAGDLARRYRLVVREYPALAKGRKWPEAGPLRNQEMLDEEHPSKDGTYIDQAFGFHEDPGLGKGSKDMHTRILKAAPTIPVEIYIRRGR